MVEINSGHDLNLHLQAAECTYTVQDSRGLFAAPLLSVGPPLISIWSVGYNHRAPVILVTRLCRPLQTLATAADAWF